MKKILFFGASVTAQTGESGYFQHLNIKNVNFQRIAIGACHLNDAGFYLLNNVIELRPDYCVLEWSSTGNGHIDEFKISTILNEFANKNINPIFLILPRIGTNIMTDREIEKKFHAISDRDGIPLIDLRNKIDVDKSLRDDVHTNLNGARIYAQLISDEISNILTSNKKWQNTSNSNCGDYHASMSLYKIDADVQALELNINKLGKNSDLQLGCIYGPHSPIIDISVNHNHFKKINLFDKWCSYERKMFVQILTAEDLDKYSEEISIRVSVSSQIPDYTIIGTDFRIPKKRFIRTNGIYGFNVHLNKIIAC